MALTEEQYQAMQEKTSRRRVVMKDITETEEGIHLALIAWAKLYEYHSPALSSLLHIPNGGSRHVAEAKKLKAMGVRPGVPDLFLPVPRGMYHGLWIELKSERGRLSHHQAHWARMLGERHYLVYIVFGFDQAKEIIEQYLALPDFDGETTI